MKNKLYIIGNGFDLAHRLPSKFDPDFKEISKKYEFYNFWDLYQSQKDDIWSDFENLLAHPDFNSLEDIFSGYSPDYSSDRESDRDGIIIQADMNGNLHGALKEFANHAEEVLKKVKRQPIFAKMFEKNDLFINFNYTHTLEKIYNIDPNNILHIHGEVGKGNLELGYPEEQFYPEKYYFDVRAKGVGPYRKIGIREYIDGIEDYYVRTAYLNLLKKTKSFFKEGKLPILDTFLNYHNINFDQIIVYGHSCAIDFQYFDYLNIYYPSAKWEFYVKGGQNSDQFSNVKSLVKRYLIKNYSIKLL